MSENKETEYHAIIFPREGKEIRVTIVATDPLLARDQLKKEYGEDTIISVTDPIAAKQPR